MIKSTLRFTTIFCIVALILSLSACTFYQSGVGFVEKDGVGYIVSGMVERCFVYSIEIPEGKIEYEVTIPDKIDSGHKVEGLGGYTGTGVPNPCVLSIENIIPADMDSGEYQKMLDAGEFTDYTLTVNVGKHVRKIFFADFSAYNDYEPFVYIKVRDTETTVENETEDTIPPQYIRIKVIINVDEDNEQLYSVDGIVYHKDAETK